MLNLLVLLIVVNLVCGLVVFRVRNPVLSAFYLIFMYIIASVLLYCYYLEFFGYIYVIVYIGAIFVLFLIIVMLTSTSVLVRMYVVESVLILLLVVLVAGFVWLFFYYVGNPLDLFELLVLFDYGLIGSGRRMDVRSLVREIKLDISEFTTDVIRKLGTVLYSKYFFAIMLGLLVLIVGCIVVSVWLKGWLKGVPRKRLKRKES